MRLNSLLKLTSFLSLAGLVNCGGYKMSFYGETPNDRPSETAIPACGIDGVDLKTDYFIAMNHEEYDETKTNPANPNTATICNKCIKIMYEDKWVVGRVVDRCPACPNKGLDVSPKIFNVFAHEDVGILYMDWEYADCSLLGKRGTCNGKCSSSNSNSATAQSSKGSEKSDEKNEKEEVKTVKKTTTISPKTTTEAKPTAVVENIPRPKNIGLKENPVKANPSPEPEVEIEQATAEQKEDGNTYALPITGVLFVSGAAGAALIYAKRENSFSNLKEKFPDAFSNIKRNLTRGSSQLRRGLSNSGRALKRSLSKREQGFSSYLRTKRENRHSLNTHYRFDDLEFTYNNITGRNLHDDFYPDNYYDNNHYNNGNYYYNESYYTGENENNNPYVYQFNSYDEYDDNYQVDFHDSNRNY